MTWFGKKTEQNPAKPEMDMTSGQEEVSTVYDRKHCDEYLTYILSEKRQPSKGVVLKLHIENFKRLNHVFSYEYCEELLRQIVSYFNETAQVAVYRYIGVEFIMVFEDAAVGTVVELCDKIAQRFDQVWRIRQTDCLCVVQMGICSYPGNAETLEAVLKYLDLAIVKASDYGPNQTVVYDSTLHEQFGRRQAIAGYLNYAVENKEVEVRFRPTYHIEKRRFVRAELYMRVFVKGLGMIGSAEFLPVAEDSGQIWMLECFALDQVGSCIAGLIEAGIEFESISTRISPIAFLHEEFIDEVKRVLHRYQIPRGKLAIEVTESIFTTAYLDVNVMLQQLSELGVEMILNDFGSGYSSISSILDLPVDTVKLERMFIWQINENPRASILIDGLVKLAKSLDLRMIAEGVETQKQLDVLNGAGCQYQQGFYYSPTIGSSALQKIMDTSLEDSAAILAEEKEKMK